MEKIKEIIHLNKFKFTPFEQFEIQKSLYLCKIIMVNNNKKKKIWIN